MKAGKASATARLIAGATLLCANDRRAGDLVSPGAAGWCDEFLSTSRADRWLRASARRASARAAWRLLERATHPGIVRHWMLRKRWVEWRVRAKIAAGTTQVVVLGAGLDSLGVRLKSERPSLRVVEIDHPATLAVKQSVFERRVPSGGPLLAEADLSRDDATGSLIPTGVIDRSLSSVFVAEGLLMYLPEPRVRSLVGELATVTDTPSALIFSFMIERTGGVIGFKPQSALVSWWLKMKEEPFQWSLDPARVEQFARELGWSVTAHADSHVLAGLDRSAVENRAMVTGEELIEATKIELSETPKPPGERVTL